MKPRPVKGSIYKTKGLGLVPAVREGTRLNSQSWLNGAFAVILMCVHCLLTHTHQQKSSILQAAPSISERSDLQN